MVRWGAMTVVAMAALVVLAVLILHTNPVQHRVLQWSVGELERRFDLDLSADDLHYNLAARRVTMTNVRLAALDHLDNPFFTADRVTVQLPWAVFRGRLRFNDVAVEQGRVTIWRGPDGESNLPPGGAERAPDAPPRRIDIRGLTLRDVDFSYNDLQRDLEIRTPDIHTDLVWDGEGAAGPLRIEGDTEVRIRDRTVEIAAVSGRMMFDGSGVTLRGIELDTTDGDFRVSGDIARALDRPTLDLTFEGTTDLSRSTRWAPPPIPVAGQAAIVATMTGAPSEFVLDARVTASDLTVGNATGVAVSADARLTPDRVTVPESSIRPSTGGEIAAIVDVPFDDERPWRIDASYRGIDAATAFELADVDPLPFGAVLSGDAVISRSPGEPFGLTVSNTSTPRPAAGRAPLEGVVDFSIAGDRWRAGQRHRMGATRVTGDLGGRWNREQATRSTFDGQLDVETGDVGEAARFAALFDLDTPAIVRDLAGPMTAQVAMGGTFTSPEFRGRAQSPALVVPSLGETRVETDFVASPDLLHASNLAARIGTTAITGALLANFDTRQLTGALQLQSPEAADLMSELPAALRLEGPLDGTVTFAGTVDAPDIVARIEGRNLRLAGQPVASLDATARIEDDEVVVDRVTLDQAGAGDLSGSGRYNWTTERYVAEVEGSDLVWRGTLGALGDAEARFAIKFSGDGPVDAPTGEGVIEFALTEGAAGALVDRGLANVRLNGDLALVTAHVPSLGALLTAKITPRGDYPYDAVLVMNRIPLAPVLRLTGADAEVVAGTASLSATASGTLQDITGSQAFINLQDVDAAVAEVPVRLTAPARIGWNDDALTVDTLDMLVGQGRLRASGRLGRDGVANAAWESTFTGALDDLVRIGRPFGVPAELVAAGPVTFEWQSTGGLDRSKARLHLDNGSLAYGVLPAVRHLALDAVFDGQTLTLSQLTGQWQDGGIEATASIPRAVLEADAATPPPAAPTGLVTLRVSGLTEEALAPWLSSAALAAIDGRLSATLEARLAQLSLAGVDGTLVVDEADFTIAGVGVKQMQPSILAFDGGVVTARDVSFDMGGSPLTITGTARLAPADQQTLDFQLRGTADLKILSAFAPTIATAGLAKVDMGIGGVLTAPVFNGRIDVSGAEVAIREPRIVISDLGGTIAMDGQRVIFDAFSGSANGGRLALDGGYLLEGFAAASGGLTVVIDGAALEYPEGLQSEANALVTLRPGPQAWSLTGDVTVVRSAYTDTISLAGLIAARGARASSPGDDEDWIDRLRLNLFVTTLQDIVVDNNYGRFEAQAALRVIGTIAEPVVAGRVTLVEGGEIFLAGNRFHIARGNVSFTNPFRIVPEFDMELRALVGGRDLTLTLDGPLERLRTDVRSSDPSVDSREAVSMLFGGFQGEDAITLLSAEVLGVTGRAIGLDTLRVERGFDVDEFRADPGLIATETDPSTRLTLSKRLRPDVELILSQSLRESGGLSAVISYKPRRNIELRAVSRDSTDRSVALRHEITFGGTSGGGGSGSDGPAAPIVEAIRITGNPGRPLDELRARLELDEGEAFDFHRWQRDIDALREVYQEHQRFEARVRGSRTVSDDGKTVKIEYDIEPGPVGELIVEGHPLEPGLQNDIREVWRRTIFDRFLLEDIRARVMRHLIEEDYIGSTVTVEIIRPDPDVKQVRVTVDAGTAVDGRRIRYRGNQAFSDGRLDDVLEAEGLMVDAWLEPRLAAETLARFYRAQGYLSARVTADAPRVENHAGVLPIAIEPGTRSVIGTVRFPGVSPSRVTEVASAVRLDSGMPFVAETIDAARTRIENVYMRDGFNSVQIEVQTDPNPEADTVDVTYAVLEGLQQVLREVTTSGATRTDDVVIRQALRLRPGEPVSLIDWAQARKRMYDTNVFRQVDIQPVEIEATPEDIAAGIQPVRAVVRVVEYPVWRLRYGLQVSDENREVPDPDGDTRLQSLGLLADLQNQNLFGRAVTAGIAGRYERNRQAGSLFTSNGSFFGLPIRSSGFVFWSRQRFFASEEVQTIDERVGISAEQRWRPGRLSEVIWSYRFERGHIFDPDPAPGDFLPLDVVINISRLNVGVFFDRRDDPTDPTRGWFNSANYEQAIRTLGSDYGNAKLLFQQSIYRGVGRLVFAGRAQFGTSFGEEALIASERFLLGGGTTVRGYAENSLGPRDVFGLPGGGDSLLNFNSEMRFPVRGWVQGVVFADAGNVFASRGDVSFGDLALGYGIGLRLASPFAMLRVDYGIPNRTLSADRPGGRFSSGRWYFGVGHIF